MSMLETDFYQPPTQDELKPGFLERLSKIPAMGIIFAAIAAVLFATGSLCAKLVETVDAVETVLFRSIVQSIIYTTVVISYRERLSITRGERLPLVARCVCGFITACCNYYAIQFISLGDQSTISFSSPVFVSLFACICLSESCGLIQAISAGLTIIGVVMICKPPFLFGGESSYDVKWGIGVGTALAGSITRAVNVICLRRMRQTPSAVVIFYFSVSGILQSLILLLIIGDLKVPGNLRDSLMLIGVGVTTAAGQFFQTFALKIEEAGPVSMTRTLDIVMSFVYQVTLLNESVEWTDLSGAAIVCCSVILVGLHKWYTKSPEVFKSIIPARLTAKISSINTTTPNHTTSIVPPEDKRISYLATNQGPTFTIGIKK